jgi:ATP diphosphatase
MQRSAKLQKRAANVGFDWPDLTPVLANMAEERRLSRREAEAYCHHESR